MQSVTILRTPEDLYQFWRQVENAPLYMQRIASVTRTGERTSHWSAQLPGGRTVEWDSQITEEIPSRLIAWQITDTVLIEHRGRVRFEAAPGDQGTVVTLEVELPRAGGILSRALGDLPGKLPEQLIREDLRRFKELMEAGEVPTIKGQPLCWVLRE